MIIESIEVCGFRGFRDKARLECGRGFTVISGRNGAGKSTLCDAVEFAVTGTIEKYVVEKAAHESLEDYIWWRGNGIPERQYVAVTFSADDGSQFTVTRSSESGVDISAEEIRAALCRGSAPEDALKQLMRTTIIRDEWITALSLDLTETKRFEFVRGALGDAEGVDLASKAAEVVSELQVASKRRESEYEAAHARLADFISQHSEARAALGRSEDLEWALQVVSAYLGDGKTDVSLGLSAGRGALVEGRVGLERKGEGLDLARELAEVKERYYSPDAVKYRETVVQKVEHARERKSQVDATLAVTREELATAEEADRTASSLGQLLEHGEQLGLHSGHCPLCAVGRSLDEFRAGLEMARRRLEALSSGVQSAREKLTTMQEEVNKRAKELEAAETNMSTIQVQELAIHRQEAALAAFFEKLGLNLTYTEDSALLEEAMNRDRDRLIDLERALVVLESSQFVSRISQLEHDITEIRQEVDRGAESSSRGRSALAVARDMERTVKRINGEIIDEKLAEISPLLNELYQRLRPHTDWRTIQYHIRGEVRKFLSLRVGDGLNPQFVFSSGQRRAAGIAFLLAVHLARAWTDLRSLILDDPVQHIDDYRSLQLVEVLAALRLEGRQIICAVEDAALADLLCRRLESSLSERGRRVDVGLGSNGRIGILRNVEMSPMPVEVLRQVEGL